MSETTTAVQAPSKQDQLKDIEAVRDLFARAHDYIAQATYPGHLGMKVAEVMNFLAFQRADFKRRGETLAAQIKSEVDVEAARAATAAALAPEPAVEAPKA